MCENPAELYGTPDFNVKRSVASVKTLGPLAQACFNAKGLSKHLVPERRDAAIERSFKDGVEVVGTLKVSPGARMQL